MTNKNCADSKNIKSISFFFLKSDSYSKAYTKMMSHVFILALVIGLFFNVISAFLGANSLKTFTFGEDVQHQLYIKQRIVHVPAKPGWFCTYEETFSLPPDFNFITQVIATNLKTSGPYGKCKIVDGGPGRKHVTLRFKSQINQPINFLVQLYGFWNNSILSSLSRNLIIY